MLDPLAPLEIVRANSAARDPALDADAMGPEGLGEYYRTHDPALLKLVPGVTPTRFVVQPLSAMYMAHEVEPLGALTRQAAVAALAACHEVKLPDGTTLRPAKEPRPTAFGMKLADAEWAETLARRFGLETLYEIGLAAIHRARLPSP